MRIHDPAMLLAGGWAPETPQAVMTQDLRRVVAVYNNQHPDQQALVIDEVQSPAMGQYITYKFAENEHATATKLAWNFVQWYNALPVHDRAKCTGSQQTFWTRGRGKRAVLSQSLAFAGLAATATRRPVTKRR